MIVGTESNPKMKNLRRTLKLNHLLVVDNKRTLLLPVGAAQITPLHKVAVQFLHLSLVVNWYNTAVKENVWKV